MICLLGPFRLLKQGCSVIMRGSAKTEGLLLALSLGRNHSVPRETLLETLWPHSDRALAGQSLNSLVYSLNKLLGDALGGAALVHQAGCYRLNLEAGVRTDVMLFDALTKTGEEENAAGNSNAAVESFIRALRLYRGDLCASNDTHLAIERERLRARYLTLLARLAEHYYEQADYAVSLDHALRLLAEDPYREDAVRLAMRCYVRKGERAQAFRLYRLCETILSMDFDAAPEPATQWLFDQIRTNPANV